MLPLRSSDGLDPRTRSCAPVWSTSHRVWLEAAVPASELLVALLVFVLRLVQVFYSHDTTSPQFKPRRRWAQNDPNRHGVERADFGIRGSALDGKQGSGSILVDIPESHLHLGAIQGVAGWFTGSRAHRNRAVIVNE